MGQSAFSNGYAQFDTTENAMDAFEKFQDWVNTQINRRDANFCIENVNLEDSNAGVSYVVSSGRIDNCQWQCEEIRDFLKIQPGCQSISQDIVVLEESVNWSKDAEDFDTAMENVQTFGKN